jgi:hypothetical protein
MLDASCNGFDHAWLCVNEDVKGSVIYSLQPTVSVAFVYPFSLFVDKGDPVGAFQ